MQQTVRMVLIIGGVLMLLLAAYFYWLWWSMKGQWTNVHLGLSITPISFGFIASMQAAIAAAMLWIGISGELGALAAGALNLFVMMSGLAYSLFLQSMVKDAPAEWRQFAIVCVLFAIFNLLLFLWSRRFPILDARPIPALLRISYPVFILVLLVVGGSLLVSGPGILPWQVEWPLSTWFGWMFFADAFYFAYALLIPRWNNARSQLWSFLAYSLVLLGPLGHRLYQTLVTDPDNQLFRAALPNLVIYLAVLIYSLLLGIYYLLLNPQTRHNFTRTVRS